MPQNILLSIAVSSLPIIQVDSQQSINAALGKADALASAGTLMDACQLTDKHFYIIKNYKTPKNPSNEKSATEIH